MSVGAVSEEGCRRRSCYLDRARLVAGVEEAEHGVTGPREEMRGDPCRVISVSTQTTSSSTSQSLRSLVSALARRATARRERRQYRHYTGSANERAILTALRRRLVASVATSGRRVR